MFLIELEILTEQPELIQVCKQYWELLPDLRFASRTHDISREFGIKQHQLISIVNQNCNAWSTNIVCAKCGSRIRYKNRTDFQQNQRYNCSDVVWKCENCSQQEIAARQAELAAQEEQRRVQQEVQVKQRREAVRSAFDNTLRGSGPADPYHFPLRYAVHLLSLVRVGASEDLETIRPLEAIAEPFSGNQKDDIDILMSLYKTGFIFVDPESDLSAFRFDEKGQIKTFLVSKVSWVLCDRENIELARSIIAETEELFRDKRWPSRWFEDVEPLWQEIAIRECIQYLILVLEEHRLSFSPGEKTKLIFKMALEEYSIAQVIGMIWRAGKDAAAFYMRGGVAPQHAANTAIGSIQRQADRARAGGWEPKSFRRDRRCPQPMISQVLFNLVLQVGNDGLDAIIYKSMPGDYEREAEELDE